MIIGREKERRELLGLLEKEESQFCAVYGRRRVGKTYLIRETFNYQFCFQHTGVAQGTLRQQLTAFRNSLVAAGLKSAIPKSWIEAFEQLKILINNAPEGKKVLFIDELPWMDTPKGNLIGALENFWNGWATARREKDIVLIVCGSATSWISKKLLKDKGGLRGRLTNRIKLVPFTLRECELFAKGANLAYERKDVLELYMILGGIPYYWSFLKKGLSVSQNVDQLLFSETAQLHDEFEALYSTLFKRPENYLKVIECLCVGRKSGMTRDEILKESKLSDGGTFSTILEELEESGVIRRFASADSLGTNALYQIIDNYTLFHYLCIKKNAYSDEHYWSNTFTSISHSVWKGHAFERVCLQHIPQIKAALGIYGVQTNVCSWFARGTDQRRGTQIDLVMQRADGFSDICEMKHAVNVFTIDKDYADDLRNKLITYQELSKDKRTLHLVMVTTYGVAHNSNYNMIQNEVTMDDLFAI
ncbi:MAG: ATP-binding protein [Muribaculaceae bacterium]|nr:ATP-binding protein [Muribaculaceae bacterium]